MELRDKLNSLEGYQEIIDRNEQYIKEDYTKIQTLEEAEIQGVQKYPKTNLAVIKSTKESILEYKYKVIRAKYSLGMSKVEIEKCYYSIISSMQESWKKVMVMYLWFGCYLSVLCWKQNQIYWKN